MPIHRHIAPLGIVLLLAVALSGCASSGAFLAGNVTDVQLGDDNYEIVAANVSGTATSGHILGLSFGSGPTTTTLALARVSGDRALYETALADLWENFRDQHGEVEGRTLALVNVRYDVSALNLVLYTEPTVTVRADVVEFAD